MTQPKFDALAGTPGAACLADQALIQDIQAERTWRRRHRFLNNSSTESLPPLGAILRICCVSSVTLQKSRN